LIEIERIEDDRIIGSIQAGALTRPDTSVRRWRVPTQIDVGDVLQPFVRRADRHGIVGPDGVEPVEWTLLTVTERKEGAVTCSFESGYRQPFRTRRSARVQQLAKRVQPQSDATTLQLVDRKDPSQPLVAYEVYRKLPGSEQSEFIGRTDWQGRLAIMRQTDAPLEILFVRSGQQLIGKLPMLPGDRPLLVAPLRNDEPRLEAEGFLVGVQDSLVDLVARREVLASRIRKLIDAGDLDQAAALLKELRGLDTQDDFARRVQQRKQSLSSGDALVQQKIDQLFAQTRNLLGRYLNREQVEQLGAALASAQRGTSSE
jgi:hypothetical protein